MELFLRTSQTSAEPLNLRLALPLRCGRKGNGHGESLHKGQDATFGEKNAVEIEFLKYLPCPKNIWAIQLWFSLRDTLRDKLGALQKSQLTISKRQCYLKDRWEITLFI